MTSIPRHGFPSTSAAVSALLDDGMTPEQIAARLGLEKWELRSFVSYARQKRGEGRKRISVLLEPELVSELEGAALRAGKGPSAFASEILAKALRPSG